jgi:hypothetical protein
LIATWLNSRPGTASSMNTQDPQIIFFITGVVWWFSLVMMFFDESHPIFSGLSLAYIVVLNGLDHVAVLVLDHAQPA